MNFLDISNMGYERIFVIGEVKDDYKSVMHLLYSQKASHKDAVVFTGNILSSDKSNYYLPELVAFIKNNSNVYSVLGKNEVNFLQQEEIDELETNISFISSLPSVIQIRDFTYVVNAGVEPYKTIEEQADDVFYSIGEYDKDSRFYQFTNEKELSWYDITFIVGKNLVAFCYSSLYNINTKVPAGYCLGRSQEDNKLRCLIFHKNSEEPDIIYEGIV